MDEFVSALLNGGVENRIPEEYDWYAPLLGDWDFDYYEITEGKRTRHVKGEWIFRRILDGTGIEDLFICPSRATRETNPQPDGEYGTAVRMFNPAKKGYDMVYTTKGYMLRLEIHKEKEMIVCTVLDIPDEQWVFSEITENTFHWQNMKILKNGDGRVNCEVCAVRKKTAAV